MLWAQNGIKPSVIKIYTRFVRGYSAYCAACRVDVIEGLTAEGSAMFSRWYVRTRRICTCAPAHYSCTISALRAYAWSLGVSGFDLPQWKREVQRAPVSPVLEAYLKNAREQRGLAVGTLDRDRWELGKFLDELRVLRVTLSRLSIPDIDRFLSRSARQLAPATVERVASSIRCFLRFLYATGHIPHDLASAVVTPVRRSPLQPPRSLPWSTVKRIIGAIDPCSLTGRRDRAQFLLMSSCGLGAAEVLQLELSDIDWRGQRIRVFRIKTRTPIWLPLLPEIARALADYIRFARPSPTSARQIFLDRRVPFGPFTSSSVLRNRVRYLARRAGVKNPPGGTHCFRHSHASRQVELGTGIKTLADILGHRDPETTSIYTRSAVQRLRRLALPLPK